MLTKEYFTKDEIIKTMQNAEDYDVSSFEDLFNSMFNSDYYITGMYEASQALETFKNAEELDGCKTNLDGVFGAIELIKQYELDQFGEVLTPLDEPQRVANMVEYIRGENCFNEALNRANIDVDSETTEENLKKFISATKEI